MNTKQTKIAVTRDLTPDYEREAAKDKARQGAAPEKTAPQSMEHSPLPWLIAEYETFSTIKDRNGKEVGLGQFRKLDAKLIVASVNNAGSLRELLTNIIEKCTFAGDANKALTEIRNWCKLAASENNSTIGHAFNP